MTARRESGTEGVSSVVSAVLLVALFTTAMTVWTFTTLPVWVAQREANHLGEAQEAFGALKGDLDSLVAQDAPGPATTPIDLGPSKVPMLQGSAARGTLSLMDGFSIQVALAGAVLHAQDGSAIGIPDEPAGGASLTNVQALQALALGLQTGGVQGVGQEAWVQASASDGTTTIVGALVHVDDAASIGCSASGLVLRVTTPLSTRSAPVLCQVAQSIPDYTFDLLSQPLFASALRELDGPFTLTVTQGTTGGTVAGTYAAVWTDSSGIDHAIGSGTPSPYTLDEDGSRLVLDPGYQSFPSQTLVYEGGAIIAKQGSGQVMRSTPGIDLSIEGGVGSLRWTIVDLQGSGSRAGSDAVTATVRNDGSSDLLFEVTGATFTVDSAYAAAWRQAFADLVLTSASESAVTVGGSGDVAQLDLASGGTVSAWIVHLHVVDATVSIG